MFRPKNLRNVVGMERMYVVPDLTKVQQEEDRKLREEGIDHSTYVNG